MKPVRDLERAVVRAAMEWAAFYSASPAEEYKHRAVERLRLAAACDELRAFRPRAAARKGRR